MLKISQLWVYPIKSCQGVQVKAIELLPSGLKDDRSMMIVDEKGRFVTQRSDAILAHIGVALHDNTIRLSYQDNQFSFTRQYAQKVSATVWKREIPAFDQGDLVADFLTKIIGKNVRLLATRPSDTSGCENSVLFQDKQAVHLISEASITHAQHHIPQFVIDARRFRPNIVVEETENHLPAFAEDTWQSIRTKTCSIVFHEPCERCNIPSINPDTLTVEKAVSNYLTTYRRSGGRPIFGVCGGVEKAGILQVGDFLDYR